MRQNEGATSPLTSLLYDFCATRISVKKIESDLGSISERNNSFNARSIPFEGICEGTNSSVYKFFRMVYSFVYIEKTSEVGIAYPKIRKYN